MFSCPNCAADRSRVLPVDPCPGCGALLVAPEVPGENFSTADENEIQTLVADGDHQAAAARASAQAGKSDCADTVGDEDPLDGAETLAYEGDENASSAAAAVAAETSVAAASQPAEVNTATTTKKAAPDVPRPPATSSTPSPIPTSEHPKSPLVPKPPSLPQAAAAKGEAKQAASEGAESPFDAEDSVDPASDSGVLTKTLAEASAPPLPAAPPPAEGSKNLRAPSPDVYTRTIADAQVGPLPQAERALSSAPSPAPLPAAPPAGALVSPVAPAPLPQTAPVPTPAGGRPSDVLPRPPVHSVIRPDQPAAMPSPVPPHSPLPPPPSDQAMATMPAAYALPNTGHAGAPPVVATPLPGNPGTPGPPAVIGPPPDLSEGANLGAALDSPPHDDRQNTPAANAVWRTAHPSAQKWAAKRHGGAVRTPKPGIIALGLLLSGFGFYLLTIFLPSKSPLSSAERDALFLHAGIDEHAWRFTEDLFGAANLNAVLFVLLGAVIVVRGAFFRQLPLGQSRTKFGKPAIMLLSCFALLAISFAALVLSASV